MKAATTQRVLIYRLGSLGDTVVALPCLHRVAQSYPEAERIVLTNFPVHAKSPPLEAVLAGSGLVHRYISYPVGTRSLRRFLALRRDLRALGARTLVYLTPARGLAAAWRDWFFFKLCGFRQIVGAPLWPDLQTLRVDADGLLERECQRLARCLEALGPIELDDAQSWSLRLSAEEREAARRLVEPLAARPSIAINMGGKVARNDWGLDRWSALAAAMRERCGDHALLVVGGPEDAERARTIEALWPAPVLNLCGQVTPRVSAAVMATASFFIGHDSGPMHLAACMGVPCIGLFGDNNPPRKWHPYGPRHRVLHDMRGVRSIEVEQVLGQIEALLEGVVGR